MKYIDLCHPSIHSIREKGPDYYSDSLTLSLAQCSLFDTYWGGDQYYRYPNGNNKDHLLLPPSCSTYQILK